MVGSSLFLLSQRHLHFHSIRVFKFKVSSRLSQSVDDGSPDQFLQSNSIADFMWFQTRTAGELQTAVVSYRNKLPWFLLQPFLQVDLVLAIHIADKEYLATRNPTDGS